MDDSLEGAAGAASASHEPGAEGPSLDTVVQARQRAVDALCEAFANDELEVEDFERRVAVAHRAGSSRELERLLSDLPSARSVALERVGSPSHAPAPAPAPGRVPTMPAEHVRSVGVCVGIMGGTSRRGRWPVARRNVAVGIMGGCTLDFREAVLPPGVTEVFAVAVCGGVEVVVPPWLRVETSGVGIMGGFDHAHDAPYQAPEDAPVLRVSGVALMGGVEVTVRLPGETARDARRRRKEERRTRKLGPGEPTAEE